MYLKQNTPFFGSLFTVRKQSLIREHKVITELFSSVIFRLSVLFEGGNNLKLTNRQLILFVFLV